MRRALLLASLLFAPALHAAVQGGTPVALVTAEKQNQLVAVELPSGKVLRRLTLPADPENVDARPGVGTAVVVSARAGAVTLVSVSALRIVKVLRGLGSPHIVAIDPLAVGPT